jgi:tryptophan synthase beta subunit
MLQEHFIISTRARSRYNRWVEAAGKGSIVVCCYKQVWKSGAFMKLIMQTPDGQITEPYSIPGLDYPGVGPYACAFATSGREFFQN